MAQPTRTDATSSSFSSASFSNGKGNPEQLVLSPKNSVLDHNAHKRKRSIATALDGFPHALDFSAKREKLDEDLDAEGELEEEDGEEVMDLERQGLDKEAGRLGDQTDGRDLLDTESRDKLLIILRAMDQKLFLLHSHFPVSATSSDPTSTTTLHNLLTISDAPPREPILEFLKNISPVELSPNRSASNATSNKVLVARHNWARSVRYLLNAFGEGQRGTGIDNKPRKLVSLYQKLPSWGQPPQWGGTFFTDPVLVDLPNKINNDDSNDSESEDNVGLTGIGYANQIEIHPTPLMPIDQEPKLGQASIPRVRRVHVRQTNGVTLHPVSIINPSPFSSFCPSYDSSQATMSFTESVQQSKRDLQELMHRAVQVDQSLNTIDRLAELDDIWGADDLGSEDVDVDKMLERNWRRARLLQELQVGRVRREESEVGEVETRLAQSLSASLAWLVSSLAAPSTDTKNMSFTSLATRKLITPSQLHNLQSLISLSNPRPSYRGTLDPTKPYTLKDNTTVRIHSLAPSQQAGSINRQPPSAGVGRMGTPVGSQKSSAQLGNARPQPFRPPLAHASSSSSSVSSNPPSRSTPQQFQPQQQQQQQQQSLYSPSQRPLQSQYAPNGGNSNQTSTRSFPSGYQPSPGQSSDTALTGRHAILSTASNIEGSPAPGTPVGVMGWRLGPGVVPG